MQRELLARTHPNRHLHRLWTAMANVPDRQDVMTATINTPADLRACATCKKVKPTGEFRWRKNGSGNLRPRAICKTCENAENRARMTARRPEISAARRAARAVTGEITALIRATTVPCKGPKAPLPTREQLAAWYRGGCRI